MRAFILGAGASRGSFDKTFVVPTATEFGQAFGGISASWRDDCPALSEAAEHLGIRGDGWSLERLWSGIDWHAKLAEALPAAQRMDDAARGRVSRDLKKALLCVYGDRCAEAAAEGRVRSDSTLVKRVCAELKADDVLISFNYDTVAETLVKEHSGCELTSEPSASGKIQLVKPHGSVSWQIASGKVTWHEDDRGPLLKPVREQDVDSGKEPLLLGAVPIKSEIIREARSGTDVFNVVSSQWRSEVEAIRACDALVVVGYSFPVEDHYGRFLFQDAVRRRASGLHREFFEREDRAPAVVREIFGAFDSRITDLVCRGKVMPSGA